MVNVAILPCYLLLQIGTNQLQTWQLDQYSDYTKCGLFQHFTLLLLQIGAKQFDLFLV
jgi:hypothetical protein